MAQAAALIDDELESLLLLGAMFYINETEAKRKAKENKYKKRFWVQEPNLQRDIDGGFVAVFEVYKQSHPHLYKDCLRMEPECFDKILEHVRPAIAKLNTPMRDSISPEQRLSVAMVYLATGDSMRLIAMFFRMGISTVREIIYETCDAIWSAMKDQYMKTPSTNAEWSCIAAE